MVGKWVGKLRLGRPEDKDDRCQTLWLVRITLTLAHIHTSVCVVQKDDKLFERLRSLQSGSGGTQLEFQSI